MTDWITRVLAGSQRRRGVLRTAVGCGTVVLLPLQSSWAAAYPERTVTIVNPYAPGGGVDPVARLIAQKLTERLGQQFIVENRMGAAGMIGAGAVAAAKPDGYTLLMSASNDIAINQHLYKNIRYNAETDFAPITQLVRLPMVLVVHPDIPARDLKEFVALLRARPGHYTYASPGNGTLQHLIGARLLSATQTQMLHVPYKERLFVDLLAGQVHSAFLGVHVVAQQVRAGKLRALAITSPKRWEAVKEIPTAGEQGLPELEVMQWFGAYAPAKTPIDIVQRLHSEIAAVLALPEVVANLESQGAEPVASSPEAFARFIKAEIARFGQMVKTSGATVEQ